MLTLSINKIDPDTLIAVIQDITRAIEQEQCIRDDQQRFRAIFENVRDYAIFTLDLHGRIDAWNRSLQRLGGWEPADVIDMPLGVFFPPGQAEQSHGRALLDRARQYGTASFEEWSVCKDGTSFWGNTVATALPDRNGQAGGYVVVTRDGTERKLMEDRLVALAATDPLTGASNRRAGEARLSEAFLDLRRHGRCFAVLMVDCDHFKSINDRWGHDAGDAVLAAMVRMCDDNLRRTDVTIRWGGEEFVLLLPQTDRDTASSVAERLRLAIASAPICHANQSIPLTVSIGLAIADAADANADDVIRRADRALYDAKRGGRNCIAAG